ncbi:DUF4118 domain-containing protein [Streptomyces sp. NPDC004270]
MSGTSAGMGHATFRRPVPVPTRNGAALAAGLALPFLVALALVPFRTDLSHTNAALVLVVVVVAVAALGSRLAGAVAALSAAAWFARGGAAHEHSFLTRPYETQAGRRHGDRRGLPRTADLVRSAKSADVVVDHVRGELTGLLGLSGCRFEYGTLLGQPARLGKDGGITVGRRAWDLERSGWPEGEIELRAYGNGHYLGRFMLTPGSGPAPPLQARLVAVTLADQTGAALDTAGPVSAG